MQYSNVTEHVIIPRMGRPKKTDSANAPHPNNLAALMERDQIKPADIAKLWGVGDADVSQRVNGKVMITPDRAMKLYQGLGWTPSEIYGVEDIAKAPLDYNLLSACGMLASSLNAKKKMKLSDEQFYRFVAAIYEIVIKSEAWRANNKIDYDENVIELALYKSGLKDVKSGTH